MGVAHTRKQVCRKLIFAKKVKNVALAASYQSTWRDPIAQKVVQSRRRELLARDAHMLPSQPLGPLFASTAA
jgi:deoxycytidylate deaminase